MVAFTHVRVRTFLSGLKVAERKKEEVGSSQQQEKEDVGSQQTVDSRLEVDEQKKEEESGQKETNEVEGSQ